MNLYPEKQEYPRLYYMDVGEIGICDNTWDHIVVGLYFIKTESGVTILNDVHAGVTFSNKALSLKPETTYIKPKKGSKLTIR